MIKRKKKGDGILVWLIRLFNYFVVFIIGYIIFDIVWNGIGAINWEFLTSPPSKGGAEGGILPAILGTLLLALGTIVFALPLGMLTAIYLSEYAKDSWFTNILRMAIRTLAGVPSIVFGLFGLGLFCLFLGFGQSLLAGCLTLAIMVLPIIIVTSEEALRAVPMAYRASALALGATKWQTVRKAVLPYSIPGMITGSILGISRAAGETAPILLTAAVYFLPRLPDSVYSPVMALPYHLFILATQLPDQAKVRPLQYGTALVLLILVLGLNLISMFIRTKLRKKYRF
jgi:phosphate transport system permease protein